MEIVNGYPCANCTDVEKAKKGVDPAKAAEETASAKATPDASRETALRGPAVSFGGNLAPPGATNGVETVRPVPYAPGAGFEVRV